VREILADDCDVSVNDIESSDKTKHVGCNYQGSDLERRSLLSLQMSVVVRTNLELKLWNKMGETN
jgi:hypothetical protein